MQTSSVRSPRQLDTDTLERLLDDGFAVKQWRTQGLLHVEILGTWKQRPEEVDQRIAQIVDLRPFTTNLTGTDPTNRTRFLIYIAIRAATQSP